MNDAAAPPGRPARPRPPRLVRAWLLAVAVSLASAAAYTTVLISERGAALHAAARYNVSQTVGQAALELTRLQAAVGAFAARPGERGQADVQLWLAILGNRLALLRAGEAGRFVRGDPGLQAAVEDLDAALAAAEPLAGALRDDPGAAARLMDALAPLTPQVVRLAAAAHARAGDLSTSDLEDLERLHWLFSALLAGLVACSFAQAGVLAGRNRQLRRAGAELARASEQAREAMEEVRLQNLILQERDRDLHTRNARFDAALNNMSQGLCMVDAGQRLIVCNVRFLELFGLSPGVARPGVPAADLFRAIAAAGRYHAALVDALRGEQAALGAGGRGGTFFAECPDGRAVAASHRPMADGGWVATYEDVTERRRAEARVTFLAHHDALTSLPNRVLFRDRVEAALRGLRGPSEALALLCLDLDHFKNVNDTLGHPAGDALLEVVGRRLLGCVRETDVVGRLGGDEFAVLHLSGGGPPQAEALARRIIAALGAPYNVGGRRVVVGASVGLAFAAGGDAGASPDVLLKNADMALYRAKAEGRGTFRVFEAEMDAAVQARLAIECDLREALELRQFELHYQPLFDLRARRVSGYEALIRWRHPARGLIPPAQFVPVAEETGLIVPIGDWVAHRACADAAAWPAPVKVAVNLSPVHFRAGDVAGTVAGALRRSGLDPSRLELEITETALLRDSDAVVATLHRVRGLGPRIAMDDFGTGYSSLSYLRSFPFDKIKIDQSFVREMGSRPDCFAIVNSVSDLAARLGMTTTAEGVETAEQLDLVRRAGCTEAQGYYFGGPLPLPEVARGLADTERAPIRAA